MANERVSQLQELFATDMQPNDLFLVTDVNQGESKRMEMGQLLFYIQSSGSFSAYHSITADTASYVKASSIDGIVSVALNASNSISASSALNARSSSYALNASTASYSTFCAISEIDSQTSSYLQYSGFPNGTSSYSLISNNSNIATVAANLIYTGIPNGTSSYAITASNSITSSYAITASNSITSSYAITASNSNISSYSINSNSSSYALTASYSNTSGINFGPKFIPPVIIANAITTVVPFTTFDCTSYVPLGTKTVILDGWADNSGTNTAAFIYIRAISTGYSYILTSYKSGGSGDAVSMGGQGSFPVTSTSISTTFQYSFSGAASGGTTLRLIGYY